MSAKAGGAAFRISFSNLLWPVVAIFTALPGKSHDRDYVRQA
jgi:hypothetical protein